MATYPPPLPPAKCEEAGHLFGKPYPDTRAICRLCRRGDDAEKMMECRRCGATVCLTCIYRDKLLEMIEEDMQAYTIDMDEFEKEEPADDDDD